MLGGDVHAMSTQWADERFIGLDMCSKGIGG